MEQSQTLSNSSNKSLRGTGRFGALGLSAEAAGEIASGKRFEIYEKTAPGDERLLLDLEAELAKEGQLEHISNARDVAHLFTKQKSEFVTGVLRFRWAKSHDNDPVADASLKGMVEFELDREADDNAGMLSVSVRMGGILEKCVNRKNLMDGSISPTSHLACFLREIAGGTLPLGFFGQLQPMRGLIWIKPYAIWFP